jgi:hypothetical protein
MPSYQAKLGKTTNFQRSYLTQSLSVFRVFGIIRKVFSRAIQRCKAQGLIPLGQNSRIARAESGF